MGQDRIGRARARPHSPSRRSWPAWPGPGPGKLRSRHGPRSLQLPASRARVPAGTAGMGSGREPGPYLSYPILPYPIGPYIGPYRFSYLFVSFRVFSGIRKPG